MQYNPQSFFLPLPKLQKADEDLSIVSLGAQGNRGKHQLRAAGGRA
jgi:hypothetical protein